MSVKFNVRDNTASDYIKAGFTGLLAAISSVTLAVADGALSVPELLGVATVVLTTAGAALGLYSSSAEDDPTESAHDQTSVIQPTVGFPPEAS